MIIISSTCTVYNVHFTCTLYQCTSTSKKVPPIREQTIVAYSQVYLQYKANLFPGLLVSISVFYHSFTLKASPRPCENTSSNLLPSIGDHPTSPSRNYRELLGIIPNHIEQSLKRRSRSEGKDQRQKKSFAKNVIKVDDSSRDARPGPQKASLDAPWKLTNPLGKADCRFH